MDRKDRLSSQRTAARTCVLVLTLTGMMTLGTAAAWAGEPTPTTQSQPTESSQVQDPTESSQGQDPTESSQGQDPTESSQGQDPTDTSQGQDPTDTSQVQDPSPPSLPVRVSPRAGGPGTTVTVRADLRGCQRPDSGHGFFQDADGRDVDGLSIWLTSEYVSGGRWYTGRYRIANSDVAGLGQFGVVCDKSIVGFANFRVQPSTSPVPVWVTPKAATRGTTVKITAEVGWCQQIHIWFYDSKSDGLTMAGGAKPIEPNLPIEDGKVTASYTLTRKNAIGPARFRVVCGIDPDHARVGEASFRVLGSGGGSGGHHPPGNDRIQLPKRVDTGLGPTVDSGIDPVWLLLPAGLLLIALAVALRLRQATRRR
jgi:hypothetical protein